MSETAIVPAAKHWVQDWIDRAKGTIAPKSEAAQVGYIQRAGRVAGNAITGGAVGTLAGAFHGKFGLDVKGMPMDALVAGSMALISVGAAGVSPMVSQYSEKIANDLFVCFAFRKGYGFGKGAPLPGSVAAGGAIQRVPAPAGAAGAKVAGEDPIEKVAKGLG